MSYFASPESTPRRLLTQFERFVCRMLGIEPSLLEKCSDREIEEAKRTFCMLWGVTIYQSVVFSFCLHIMFAEKGEVRWELILAAVAFAYIIQLVEIALVLIPATQVAGHRSLQASGVEPAGGSSTKKVRFWLGVAVRLFLVVVSSQLAAIVFTPMLVSKDVGAVLSAEHQAKNAALFARQAKRIDAVGEQDKAQATTARTRLGELRTEQQGLRQITVDPSPNDPEWKAALAEADRIRTAKVMAEGDLDRAQRQSTDELGGKRTTPWHTGVPGAGPVRRAAEEDVARVQKRAGRLADDLRTADAKITRLRDKVAKAGEDKAGTASTRLDEVTREIATLETQQAAVETRLRTFDRDREKLIAAAVAADPGYVPKEDGLLARLRVMKQITEADTTTLFVVLLLDVFLFAFEASILLLKMFGADNRYAELAAGEEMIQSNDIVHELADTINARSGTPDDDRGEEMPDAETTTAPSHSDLSLENAEVLGSEPLTEDSIITLRRGPGRPPGSKNRKPEPDGEGGIAPV